LAAEYASDLRKRDEPVSALAHPHPGAEGRSAGAARFMQMVEASRDEASLAVRLYNDPSEPVRLAACRRGWRAEQHLGRGDPRQPRAALPVESAGSRRFYKDVLGLAVYREFGDPEDPAVVFFLGGGYLEVSGAARGRATANLSLWLQVRDVAAEHQRLVALGVEILQSPRRQPWGLIEMSLADPDGVRIVLVEVPEDHALRRDLRSFPSAE
jgi:predicted enzyme related to lactoylglutathione lyase